MYKKTSRYYTFIVLIIISLFFVYPTNTYASTVDSESNIKVKLDERYLTFDVQPTIKNGRTLVPMAVIFQELGLDISWNSKTKTVKGTKDSMEVSLQIGNVYASVNGDIVKMDVPAAIVEGRTMVPLAFISQSIGAEVTWDGKTRTVIITSPKGITFPDTNLEAVIREELGKDKGDILTSDVNNIHSLNARNKNIHSIEGIQYLKNLETLNLNLNNITDVSPLGSLENLTYLYITSNFISDITPLKNNKKLKELYLNFNQIYDVSPIQDLVELSELDLYNNPVIDISPLKKLKNLKTFYIIDWDNGDKINYETFKNYGLVTSKAKEIISNVIKPGMSDFEKELALHDYVVTHTSYDYENFKNNTLPYESHTPYGVLVKGIGVCDGYARTMQILLHLAGIESITILGESNLYNSNSQLVNSENDDKKTNDGININHAWNIVKIGQDYYHLDATWNDPTNDEGNNYLLHTYFNISDNQISVNHNWDRTVYPKCLQDNPVFNMNLKLNRDTIISDDYIYTIQSNALFKISLDGKKKIKLSDDQISCISKLDNWIFYINEGDDNKIYKITTDGTNKTKVVDTKTSYLGTLDGWLYYTDDLTIYRINMDGTIKTTITSSQIDVVSYFAIIEDWVYFRGFSWDSARARLYKVKADGSGLTPLSGDTPPGYKVTDGGNSVSYYYGNFECIQNDWIFYVNTDDGNKIYKVKTDGSARIKINEDSSSQLEMIGDWIYYTNEHDHKNYRINIQNPNQAPELIGYENKLKENGVRHSLLSII
ncbi:MAG: DUF5050 domain-containing protein [Clostridia bacterium]|nr:DUF5050 domain-containing protein [Clostridia bacterium]